MYWYQDLFFFSSRASLVIEGFVEHLLRFQAMGWPYGHQNFVLSRKKFTKLLLRFSVFKCS
jgi:hypothetical protein